MVAVHFVLPDEIGDDLKQHVSLKVVEASIAGVDGASELFAVISSAMQFPNYFGGNWDALDECLIDLDWLPADGYVLMLREASCAWSTNPMVLGKFITAWLWAAENWAKKEVPFHLVFVM